MESEWIRIPAHIITEEDRRALCAILAAHSLEVRIVKEKTTRAVKRYVEYRTTAVPEA